MKTPTILDYQKRLNTILDDSILTNRQIWREGENGTLYTRAEWLESVKSGGLINYDGFGNFAYAELDHFVYSNLEIRPSDFSQLKATPPEWATHVIWYNR